MSSRQDDETPAEGVPSEGDVVAAKYRIESVLGEGGMGILFAATHLDLQRRVAVKFLRPKYAKDTGARQRFLREARAAAAITSEHAARIQDVAETEDGLPFIVMELLEGTDLDRLLAQRGRLPVSEAVGYVIQACDAVAEAHAAGIVHRDLKPSNLFLAERPNGDRIVKVLDFGISKSILRGEGTPEKTSLTAPNTLLGSPQYMSPEQVRNAKDVDLRSDVWALGVILQELVTGAPPFESASAPELYALILSAAPSPLRNLAPEAPAGLGDVVTRCLVKEVEGRIGSVAELALALRPFAPAESEPILQRLSRSALRGAESGRVSAPPASRVAGAFAPTVEAGGRRNLRRTVFAVLASALVAAGVLVYVRSSASRPPQMASPPPSAPIAPAKIAPVDPPMPDAGLAEAASPTLMVVDAAVATSSPSARAAATGSPHGGKVKDIRQIQLLQ